MPLVPNAVAFGDPGRRERERQAHVLTVRIRILRHDPGLCHPLRDETFDCR